MSVMNTETGDSARVVSRLEFMVRWGDSDAAGMTYYVKYFDWFTDGRIAFMQQVGLPYMANIHARGMDMLVTDTACRYRSSLRPEEKAILETTVTALTRTRVSFSYRVLREDETVAAEGVTNHAFVDGNGKPFNIAKRYPDLWEALNAAFGFGSGRETGKEMPSN